MAREKPWILKTPSGQSEFQAFRDEALDPPALVVTVGKTELRYHLRCLVDLHAMLKKHGDWMALGSADEQKPAAERYRRSVGALAQESRPRLVRAEERATRPFRQLCAPGDGGAQDGRGRAQPEKQPYADVVTLRIYQFFE